MRRFTFLSSLTKIVADFDRGKFCFNRGKKRRDSLAITRLFNEEWSMNLSVKVSGLFMSNYLWLGLCTLLCSCGTTGSLKQFNFDNTEARVTIIENSKLWNKAIKEKDVSYIEKLYDTKAHYLPNEGDAYHGKEAIVDCWKAVLPQLNDLKLNMETLEGTANLLYETGNGFVTFPTDKGEQREAFKYVNVWKRQADGGYKVVIDTYNDIKSAIEASTQKSLSFEASMQKHLDAVMNKDYASLVTTVPPAGTFHLILPDGSQTKTVKEFLAGQKGWFASKSPWTIDMKIVHTDYGEEYGMAIVEADYREPERGGKPYFNIMHITYALKKIGGKWLVVKDHASTKEKSK